jgi:coproporphyrinogen III oxidase-like Fe-S oxidoreductase
MFLGLRLMEGVDMTEASAQVGFDLAARYQAPIGELLDLGLLEQRDGRLRLAKRAYLIANQVYTRFLD